MPLRFFNIDQHASVIEDVTLLFKELGHTVDSHNLTGHNWVFGRPQIQNFHGYNGDQLHEIDPGVFHNLFKDKLSEYDGFVVCYPPFFARLWRDFGKPIIMQLPVRYEFPTGPKAETWDQWNETLRLMVKRGQLHIAANNSYDQAYLKQYAGLEAQVIESICDYTGVKYVGDIPSALLMESRSPWLEKHILENIPSVRPVRTVYGRYKWSDLVRHKAFVHVPYNASIMSFYEHYWMNVPLFVPTPEFLVELKQQFGCMGEISWNQSCGYSPGSRIKGLDPTIPDPNEFDNPMALLWWTKYYDMYQLPYVIQFDSWGELEEKLRSIDLMAVSGNMEARNIQRKKDALDGWKSLLSRIGA